MTTFLKPIIDEINTLHKEGTLNCRSVRMPVLSTILLVGLDVVTPDGTQKMRCMLLMTALDPPARALVFNMKQFNGRFGSLFCYSEGTSKAANPLHRFWPPSDATAMRTHQSMIQNAQEVSSSVTAVCLY